MKHLLFSFPLLGVAARQVPSPNSFAAAIPEEEGILTRTIRENFIVVAVTDTCKYCPQVKSILDSLSLQHTPVYLNLQTVYAEDPASGAAELQQLSGFNTVPRIFVGQTHRGSTDWIAKKANQDWLVAEDAAMESEHAQHATMEAETSGAPPVESNDEEEPKTAKSRLKPRPKLPKVHSRPNKTKHTKRPHSKPKPKRHTSSKKRHVEQPTKGKQ